MTVFSRKRLPRGIKLPIQSVYNLVNDIILAVNDPVDGITPADNFAQKETPWTWHLQVPVLDSQFFSANTAIAGAESPPVELCFPVVMLPPQDQYSASANITPTTIRHTLNTVSMSFDTRDEAAGIGDQFSVDAADNPTQAYARSDLSQCYTLFVRLSEKQPYSQNKSSLLSQRDIFSAKLDMTVALAGDNLAIKVNPFTWSNLSLQLSPYKTYWLRVACPDLYNLTVPTNKLQYAAALVSLNMQLSGTSTAVLRDRGTDIQNIPSVRYGEPLTDSVSTPTPASGYIYADQATTGGVNTAFRALDNVLSNRLKTGYGKDSALPPVENMAFAGYHMIAVPMFQAFGANNRMIAGDADKFPFTSGLDANWVVDRRIVRIEFPFTIHHVFGVQNFSAPPKTNKYPVGYQQPAIAGRAAFNGLQNRIGVTLGCGLRADDLRWEQVAETTLNGAGVETDAYDLFKQAFNGLLCHPPMGETLDYDFAVWPVPIVGSGGVGVLPQGKPVFCGLGSTLTFPRQDLNGDVPALEGGEQFLDVRWGFRDSGGTGLGGPTLGGSAPSDATVYVGTGGHWVLILGKKHPYGGKTDVKV